MSLCHVLEPFSAEVTPEEREKEEGQSIPPEIQTTEAISAFSPNMTSKTARASRREQGKIFLEGLLTVP